jgi:hypothetical protein
MPSEANLKRRDFIKKLAAVCTSPGAMLWPFAARAQNPPAPAQNPAAPAADEATGEVGQVATLRGNATVTRGNPGKVAALRINDPIFEHDALMTGPDAALGITFDDQTTFSLSANTRIVVDAFVYQKGGAGNAATFNVAVGTAAFVASLVAKTAPRQAPRSASAARPAWSKSRPAAREPAARRSPESSSTRMPTAMSVRSKCLTARAAGWAR